MKLPVKVRINGRDYQADVEPRLLLVHFLRDIAGLTGTKVGCDTSQCGACVVLLDGKAAKACTCFAVQADGAEVTTIEGLAPAAGELHPLQDAFWVKHGLQCGFCTPGMLLAAHDLLRTNPTPSHEQIRHGLEGNLCRCTGYQNIVRAVEHAVRSGVQVGANAEARS
jgi:aerobic carbon-monoxide dehydrogenase small subunit